MKKLLFRIFAFAIDMLFVNIILIGISNISFINPNISLISDEVNSFNEITNEYYKLLDRCDGLFNDNKIDLNESVEIHADYKYFVDAFYEIPVDTELDAEVKDRVISNIKDTYLLCYDVYTTRINRYNIPVNTIGIVISIIYFGIFEWYLNGRTIGKLLFKLRTVDNENIKTKIPIWKYLFKAVLVSEVIFTMVNLLFAYSATPTLEGTHNAEWYAKNNTLIYNAEYIYNTLFLIVIFISKDERSIHDKLLGIRVALFDKNNKEVKSRIFNEKTDN